MRRSPADCFAAYQTKALSEVSTRLHLGSAQALLELAPYLTLICCQGGLVCFKQPLQVLCGESLCRCCLAKSVQSFPQRPGRDSSVRMPGTEHPMASF